VHEIVAQGRLLVRLQVVTELQDHLLESLDALVGLLLHFGGFRLGGRLAFLLNGNGFAENAVFLDDAVVVGLEGFQRVFESGLVLFERFNQRGLLLNDSI